MSTHLICYEGQLLAPAEDFCPLYILLTNWKLTKKLQECQCVVTVVSWKLIISGSGNEWPPNQNSKGSLGVILSQKTGSISLAFVFPREEEKKSQDLQKAAPRTSHKLLRCQVVFTKRWHHYYSHYCYCHYCHYYYCQNLGVWVLSKNYFCFVLSQFDFLSLSQVEFLSLLTI